MGEVIQTQSHEYTTLAVHEYTDIATQVASLGRHEGGARVVIWGARVVRKL